MFRKTERIGLKTTESQNEKFRSKGLKNNSYVELFEEKEKSPDLSSNKGGVELMSVNSRNNQDKDNSRLAKFGNNVMNKKSNR